MLFLVRDTLLLIYVAALFAVGLSPVVTAIERQRVVSRIRLPRWVAILTVYLIFLMIVVTIGVLIVPPLVAQAQDLWTAAPDLLHRGQQWLIERRLLRREITVLEAVQQAPGGGSDAVGTVVAAIWGIVGGVFGVPLLGCDVVSDLGGAACGAGGGGGEAGFRPKAR